MKDEHEYFSESAVLPPLTATIEREDSLNEPVYECGNCKAHVLLMAHKHDVYRYECSACGHAGVVPRYDYERWLDQQAANMPNLKGGTS